MAAEQARPLGILAGGGTLPRRVAEAAAAQGRPVFIVAFTGQFDPATVAGFPHISLRIGEAGRILAEMRKAGVVDLVMAGGVRRPTISELGLDWRGVKLFAKIGAAALGDNGLLAAIGRELEQEGFRLVGAKDILTDGIAAVGLLGLHRPDEQAEADIAHGVTVARTLGVLDIGQAVVVQQGLVLGVEAIEGTDALIQRVGPLRRDGPGGVLVKVAKPQQDRRIDLPTIGPATIAQAAAAGLRGIAIEAGGAIILDKAATAAAADEAGLFLLGLDPRGA
jgi:DUF1009 family protein